jgi:hypothetical protein
VSDYNRFVAASASLAFDPNRPMITYNGAFALRDTNGLAYQLESICKELIHLRSSHVSMQRL